MKCAICGETLPEATGRCERCARGKRDGPAGKAPGGETPGARVFRLVTSLVDRPADPALIDESPPLGGRPGVPGIAAAGEGGQSERESVAGDRLEEDAPVAPADIRMPLAGPAEPPQEGSLNAKPGDDERAGGAEAAAVIADFGEAREAQPPLEAGGFPPGRAGDPSRRDRWETELRDQMRLATPPRLAKGGFWVRLVALWIDGLFLSLAGSIVFGVLFSAIGVQEIVAANLQALEADPASAIEILRPAIEAHLGAVAITYIGVCLAWFLYRPVCHAAWGRTLGKLVLGLRVIRTDGTPLGFGRAFLRYVGYIIALIPFGLGCIWAALDSQKQGWHDKLADTYVIKERG